METGHAPEQHAGPDGAVTAKDGAGPLLQRDYWCIVARCRVGPTQLMTEVTRNFCQFAPDQLVQFSGSCERELATGDELDVMIRLAGRCRVRVVHRDAQSITLVTLRGHPEAGRITFGAYRNDQGDVVFHIRSRARASSAANYLAFIAAGEAMQTNTWTDFVQAVAHTFGEGPVGSVQAETNQVPETPEDDDAHPTFEARGDDG